MRNRLSLYYLKQNKKKESRVVVILFLSRKMMAGGEGDVAYYLLTEWIPVTSLNCRFLVNKLGIKNSPHFVGCEIRWTQPL